MPPQDVPPSLPDVPPSLVSPLVLATPAFVAVFALGDDDGVAVSVAAGLLERGSDGVVSGSNLFPVTMTSGDVVGCAPAESREISILDSAGGGAGLSLDTRPPLMTSRGADQRRQSPRSLDETSVLADSVRAIANGLHAEQILGFCLWFPVTIITDVRLSQTIQTLPLLSYCVSLCAESSGTSGIVLPAML